MLLFVNLISLVSYSRKQQHCDGCNWPVGIYTNIYPFTSLQRRRYQIPHRDHWNSV